MHCAVVAQQTSKKVVNHAIAAVLLPGSLIGNRAVPSASIVNCSVLESSRRKQEVVGFTGYTRRNVSHQQSERRYVTIVAIPTP